MSKQYARVSLTDHFNMAEACGLDTGVIFNRIQAKSVRSVNALFGWGQDGTRVHME